MLDTLRRMFCDVRPFDILMLVVEVLVLILIAYDVGSEIWQRNRRHRRLKRVLEFLSEGQALQDGAPTTASSVVEIPEWERRCQDWADGTNDLLKRYSPQASATFLLSAGGFLDWNVLRIHESAHDTYQSLQRHLNNLRLIMERPDLYF
jgi:hypothetical protein